MTYPRDTEYRGNNTPLWEIMPTRRRWLFKKSYVLRRPYNAWPYGEWQYHNKDDGHRIRTGMRGVIFFDTREEAEEAMARMNRTWPETYEYEVSIPLKFCGHIMTTNDGIKHFYILPPYRYWCAENLGDHHGFYRYPRDGGTNYVAVRNIVDVIKLKTAMEFWERGLEAP